MGEREKAFSQESVGRLLLKFSIPIMLSYLVSELYSMVDTFVIGNYVGGDAVGGLNVVFPIQRIFIALGMMLAVGVQNQFSRMLGEKRLKEASTFMRDGVKLVLAVFVPLAVLTYVSREPLIGFLGAGENLFPYAETYLTFILPGVIALALNTYYANLLLALGKGTHAMVSTTIGATVNLALDLLLVGHFELNVLGAAISTSTSQIFGFIYAYFMLRKERKVWGLTVKDAKVNITVPAILALGLSSFIIEAEDGILIAFLNNLLVETMGEQGIIVLGMATRIYLLLFITICSIAAAMQPIASYNRGAKNFHRIQEVAKKTRIAATVTSIGIWLFLMITAPWVFSLIVKDPVLIDEAVKSFRIMIAVFPVIGVYYTTIYYYQAIGRPKKSVFLAVFRQIGIMIPLSFVLVKIFTLGALGVWLSYPISDLISAGYSLYLIKVEDKRLEKLERQVEQKEPLGQHHYA